MVYFIARNETFYRKSEDISQESSETKFKLENIKLKGLVLKLLNEKSTLKVQYKLIINLLRNAMYSSNSYNYNFATQEKLLKAITRLSLSFNSIKDPSLNYQNHMVSLNLEGVNLTKQFGILVSSLKKNSWINELNLNNTCLIDKDFKKLGTILKNDRYISTLKIGYNYPSSAEIIKFLDVLTLDNMNIICLDISGLNFDKDALSKLKDYLYKYHFLRELIMRNMFDFNSSNNRIENIIGSIFEVIPKSIGLQTLDVSCNKISTTNTITLLEELEKWEKLVSLKINDMSLGILEKTIIFDHILTMLDGNRPLECLEIGGNNFSILKLWEIIEHVFSLQTILKISFKDQTMEAKAVKALANNLSFWQSIQSLDLTNTGLDEFKATSLIAPLSKMLNLRELILDKNTLNDTFIVRFCDSIKDLTEDDFASYFYKDDDQIDKNRM